MDTILPKRTRMIREQTRETVASQIDQIEKVLGEVHGKIGEFTVYRRLGKRVIRKRASFTSPPSEKQIRQRQKFAELQKLAQAFRDILPITLKRFQKKMHLRNAFTKINQDTITVEKEGTLKTDYNKLNFTGENKPYWITLQAEPKKDRFFLQWKQPNEKAESAQIHFIAYCPTKNQTIHCATPVEQLSQEIVYPTEWIGEKIYLYSFIQTATETTETKLVLSTRYIPYRRFLQANTFLDVGRKCNLSLEKTVPNKHRKDSVFMVFQPTLVEVFLLPNDKQFRVQYQFARHPM